MRRIDLNEAANFLREHDRFLILMHGSPDGDTVGCGTALCGALQQIGKLARTACPDPLPKKFGYMFRELKEQEFEPETIVAVHSGLRVLGVSCLTNMAAGILDQPLSHQEVVETGAKARASFRRLLDGVVQGMEL